MPVKLEIHIWKATENLKVNFFCPFDKKENASEFLDKNMLIIC